MSAYAGESVGKKIARVQAYQFLRRYMLPRSVANPSILCLAGPEAADLGPIRAFGITGDPSSVLMVDVEASGLDAAKRAWLGVRTFHGRVQDCPLPRSLNVAVIDLCGSVESDNAKSMFAHLRSSLVHGSCCVVTFLRGRETPLSLVGGALAQADKTGHSRVHARAIASLDVIADQLKIPLPFSAGHGLKESRLVVGFRNVFTYRANGNTTMEMCFFKIERMYEYRAFQRSFLTRGGGWTDMKKDPTHFRPRDRLLLLSYAASLERQGVDPALALNVKPGTLRAWRAHRTMGTYGAVAS